MNKQMISWSADLLSQIFSQILESLRSPFIIEEDVLAIIEKLCYFGSYSDITAISELLLDFMLSAKEEESNRYKSLDMNIYFVEKLGIPVAYNLFSEKLLQLVKKHKHTNGFNLDKLVTTALNKLMIDLDIDMLRVVLPYFDDFFQLTHDDPKFKDVFGSKTKKSQPNNYLESYFSEICKLIYDFKNGNDEQFLKGLIPKLKADLEGNRHFINIKFSRMYQGFLSHLNNRLECILASQISRARTEDNLFESIYKQSEFYLDEPLPKETPQLRYFELFPYQYRLTKPQKMRLASLLHRMSVESRGLVLGCVSNNTIRGVVLNTVQQAVLNDEIQHVFNMLGNEAFNRCLAVTFHDVKGESVFNFQNTHRFVFKIVFNSNEELQASRFKGCESRIDNSEVVRRTYLCYWHPDWKVDEDKIQSVVQRGGREEAREVKETRVPVSVKVEKPEKTDSVEKSVSAPALKSVTLTPQSSDKATNGTEKEKEQEKEKENTNKPNGKLVEEKPSEQEIPSAWLQKIPIKKSSEPPKVIFSCQSFLSKTLLFSKRKWKK